MPAAIEPIIKQREIAQYLQGDSRDRIRADDGIGTGTKDDAATRRLKCKLY